MRLLTRLGGAAGLLGLALVLGACGAPATTAPVDPSREQLPPRAPAAASPTQAERRIAEMTLREQAATIVMGHISTTDAGTLRAYMAEPELGGFLLMGGNVPGSEQQLRALTEAMVHDISMPPLIAVDQEGGAVRRLRWDDHAAPRDLRNQAPDAAQNAFRGRAELLVRSGVNVNFGIVADVTADPRSFISPRVLGTTAEEAAARVAAAVAGERGLVASTLKHFPGHGASNADTHRVVPEIPMSQAQWRAAEAVPFAAGIDAGAELVMMGHLVFRDIDALPASVSPRWYEILRDDLGFTGIAVTDDLGMLQNSGLPQYRDPVANAVAAVSAGADLVLTVMHSDGGTATRIVDGIVAAVESGALPAERVQEAAERVIALRLTLARR